MVHEVVHKFHSVRYMLKIKMNEIKEICLFDFFSSHFSKGTNISAGKCRGIVIGTGLNTEIGEFS